MHLIYKVLAEASNELKEISGSNSIREARILLEFVLKNQEKFLNTNHNISNNDFIIFQRLIKKRLKFQPISQIIGERYFWKNKFFINSDVLDPRPDTETLIEHTLSFGSFFNILDLGTGSGCIILSLLDEYNAAMGIGVDKSKKALNVAQKNAELLNLNDRVKFQLGNWCDGLDNKFDLIVSNPPYISEKEILGLSNDVINWEPRIALTPEGDGLGAYKNIINGVKNILIPNGRIIFEIGHAQGNEVSNLLKSNNFKEINIVKDINNKDRVVSALWR
ncbi:peptide chain release factor N(5)-glutamine methyltransferase [Amylibacter sp.]|jgi:release factor glutamine methyltransferase|nr:peptide chain release factor N(5)-glutamine methyltransferase [Amylibacter sp.]MDB9851805.1 peptide chain release factor N(5)-glutamine methyltransferase [Amylibacter sp.]MDC1257450.1 peptide chain release factor N(5)-glutamine methyltransferase [Amylibacter sp.]MDC1270010.1 peptide chain release factor N(5)-glutamine methyltransferase [Amylibacter sp.]MDC1288415.1 peptide chain release factor N(5)-glutamine methyltransferase [Amylibacter sp.]|tara:strand:- start:87 stop:917 length:831 start_codon:yes stop_codon:yes gene_type:complete